MPEFHLRRRYPEGASDNFGDERAGPARKRDRSADPCRRGRHLLFPAHLPGDESGENTERGLVSRCDHRRGALLSGDQRGGSGHPRKDIQLYIHQLLPSGHCHHRGGGASVEAAEKAFTQGGQQFPDACCHAADRSASGLYYHRSCCGHDGELG